MYSRFEYPTHSCARFAGPHNETTQRPWYGLQKIAIHCLRDYRAGIKRECLHIGLGLLGNIEPGSRLSFDQEKINQEIWLPTAMDGDLNVRLLFVHAHIHLINHESGYQRFHVESQQNKDVKVVPEIKH